MVPAHFNVDGALVAHLWVCQSCGRAQAPLIIGQGLPLFPAATAGLAAHPMSTAEELEGLIKGSKLVKADTKEEAMAAWPKVIAEFIKPYI